MAPGLFLSHGSPMRPLTRGRICALLAWRVQAPFAAKNHPAEKHLFPVFVALGADGEDARPERLRASATRARCG